MPFWGMRRDRRDEKATKATMQSVVTLIILLCLAGLVFGPSIFSNWHTPSAATEQILFTLATLAAQYYLGSSASSATKDENTAKQQDKALTALAASAPVVPATPLGGDGVTPIPVTVANSAQDPAQVHEVKT